MHRRQFRKENDVVFGCRTSKTRTLHGIQKQWIGQPAQSFLAFFPFEKEISKAKMRTEILQELKKRHEAALMEIGKKPSIQCSIVDHMIAQYLQKHGYHYSLSIYAAESGVESSPAPTPMETLRVLGLNGWPKFVQIVSEAMKTDVHRGKTLSRMIWIVFWKDCYVSCWKAWQCF